MRNSFCTLGVIIGITLLLFGTNTTSTLYGMSQKIPTSLTSDWLYVGGNGPGNYTTIQSAIDSANPADIIFVYNGTYYENIIIDKSISLTGEKKETTIIDGGKTKDVVKIIQNTVYLNDFTLCNSGSTINDAGVEIRSNLNVIQNIILTNVSYGIWSITGENNTFLNNQIKAKWDGIWLFRSANTLMYNNFLYNCGIVLDGLDLNDFIQEIDTTNFVNEKPIIYLKNINGTKIQNDAGQVILVNCSMCEISNLTISNVTDCIEIMFSSDNVIKKNVLHNAGDYGIRMFQSNNNTVSENSISNNPSAGISFMGLLNLGGDEYDIKKAAFGGFCRHNIVFNNSIIQNRIGILTYTSNDNLITTNIFTKNTINAFFYNCKDIWNNNYWGRSRYLPKPIFGVKQIDKITIPCLIFDWHPAKYS